MIYRFAVTFGFCALILLATSAVGAVQGNNTDLTAQGTSAINIQRFNQQLKFQLQTQEIQLEQQLLQIKQRLLQLQQQELLQKPAQSTIDLKWVTVTNNRVPANTVVGADADGKSLYICRADYLQGTHPGQVDDKGCLITYGGRTLIQTNYQVLTGQAKVIWKAPEAMLRFASTSSMPIMPGPLVIPRWPNYPGSINGDIPVPGGEEHGQPLYICRAMFGNQIHLGKVVGDSCNIAAEGGEARVATYEVLFAKGTNE